MGASSHGWGGVMVPAHPEVGKPWLHATTERIRGVYSTGIQNSTFEENDPLLHFPPFFFLFNFFLIVSGCSLFGSVNNPGEK